MIDNFRYLVSLDNSGDPADPDPANHPGIHPLPSSSPVLIEGVGAGSTKLLRLPRHCRWLVTVQANAENIPKRRYTSTSHKMWGAHVDLVDKPAPGYQPRDEDRNGKVVKWVDEVPSPLPLGKLVVQVFPDTNPTNGAPDVRELRRAPADRPSLENFLVVLHDVGGGVVEQNFHGEPICSEYDDTGSLIRSSGGQCLTGPDGTVVIPDLAPGRYEIAVFPPQSSSDPWHGAIQTTTFQRGPKIDAAVTEKDQGTGAIRRGLIPQLAQPTAYWFGFVQSKDLPVGPPGRIRACAAHWVAFPPFDTPVLNKHEPIVLGWVALSRTGTNQQVYAAPLGDGPSCPGGVIDIADVPQGNYTMFIWDERLERVFRTIDVSVPARSVDELGTRFVDEGIGELPGDDGRGNFGVFRWSGWVSGHVFDDSGVAKNGEPLRPGAARNGIRDCVEPGKQNTCERGLPNEALNLRYRDGSTKQATSTDAGGRYEYPTELSDLYRFVIGEVGPGPVGDSGPCQYSEATSRRDPGWSSSQYNPLARCVVMASEFGRGRLTSQLTTEGHRSTVDWGKYTYSPDETGQINGVVYYATTRKEADPRFARAEPYEPGVAGVPVNLYWAGPNQRWNGGPGPGSDDVLVNRYADGAGTDGFVHPNAANQGENGACAVLDSVGNPVFPSPQTHFGLRVAPNCLEFGVTSNETKDGTFDGSFAFTDMCDPARGGWDGAYTNARGNQVGCARRVALVPGDYVVEVAAAENPSTRDSPYQIVKEEDVNARQGDSGGPDAIPFPCVGPSHLVLDARSPSAGQERPLCTHREVTLRPGQSSPSADFFLFTDTPIPGRISGLASDRMTIETDPDSLWYGKPRAIPNIPVGIRDYSYRLLETVYTDEYGFFEAVLPSTQVTNCPTPTGVCPATYVAVINDPRGEMTVTGAVTTSGTKVTGTNTKFEVEVAVGDHVRVGNEARIVTHVATNASLTVDKPWARASFRKALFVLTRDPSFSPSFATESLVFEVMPGKTTYVDASLDPISGTVCTDSGGPELFAVQRSNGDGDIADSDSGLVIERRLLATSNLRNVTIEGLGFGAERTNPLVLTQPGFVTLVHPSGTRYVLDDDSFYGGPGSPNWSDERITFRFPRAIGGGALSGAPYQVLITAPPRGSHKAKALTAPTGITLHYIQSRVYEPDRRYVDGASGTDEPESGSFGSPYRTIQYAIDRVAVERVPGRLIMVLPALYQENPVLYIRAKLQGFGPGGMNGPSIPSDTSEDDVRRSSPGTVIDASLFNYDPEIQRMWQDRINRRPSGYFPGGPLDGLDVKTHAGAGITVVGSAGSYSVDEPGLDRAIIDGFGIHSARVDAVFGSGGGGGVFVNGNGRDLWLTNNFIAGNHGSTGGGIILGQPYRGKGGDADNNNANVRIAYNRILGNGGTRWAGGIAIYNGADDYLVEHNDLCSNLSAEQGGAISHYGRSPGGRVAENRISSNTASEQGGGLSIAGQHPIQGTNLEGAGQVSVERNVLSSNQSGDGGGAIGVFGAVRVTGAVNNGKATPDRITIVNNQLSNNVAAGAGAAIALRDSPNVWLVNNTIAQNVSTASCEGCLGGPPHSGGLASELHSDGLLTLLPAGSAAFSNPLLLNNLFFGNSSYAFDPNDLPAPEGIDPATFVEHRDFEVLGRPDLRFKPWHSTLSAAYESGSPAANGTNEVFGESEDPFVELYSTRFGAGFDSRTGRATITVGGLAREDPQPTEPDGVPGDYHLCDAKVPSPSDSDPAGTSSCSQEPVQAGVASLPAAHFAGTVVPALSLPALAPTYDIDGDSRLIDVASTMLPKAAANVEIGADELTASPSTGIEPYPSKRDSGSLTGSSLDTSPTNAPAATESDLSRHQEQGPEPVETATTTSVATGADENEEVAEPETDADAALGADTAADAAPEEEVEQRPETTVTRRE